MHASLQQGNLHLFILHCLYQNSVGAVFLQWQKLSFSLQKSIIGSRHCSMSPDPLPFEFLQINLKSLLDILSHLAVCISQDLKLCISQFSITVTTIPEITTQKKKRLILAHSVGGFSSQSIPFTAFTSVANWYIMTGAATTVGLIMRATSKTKRV